MERIGFIGVGLMGEGMAANALRAGLELAVLAHRKRDAVERLCADGATEATSLHDLAERSDAIVLCLSNADTVQEVIAHLRPYLTHGQIVLDTTTSKPDVTRALARDLGQQGVVMVDAPVTGGPPQAHNGALGTLLGADDAMVERATKIVQTWSKTVRHFGPVGAGHSAKLINNFVTQGTAALLAEAYTRARRAGVDWEALHDVQCAGAARSGTFDKMVTPAIGGDYQASQFSIANAAKDARYYTAFAADMDGEASALAVAVRDAIARFEEAGFGSDHTSRMLEPAVADAVRPRA